MYSERFLRNFNLISLFKKYAVTIVDSTSEIGNAIHTPSAP